jgi:hypothetical protein
MQVSKTFNVDLMFGLPGQTDDQWRATMDKTIALQPEHISTYCLTYEEDTEFFLRHARGEFRTGFGCRRRVLRNDNGDAGRCRLQAVRDLELRASRF